MDIIFLVDAALRNAAHTTWNRSDWRHDELQIDPLQNVSRDADLSGGRSIEGKEKVPRYDVS